MANNYLQFSELLAGVTPEQRSWIKEFLLKPENDPNYAQADSQIDWDAWARDHPKADAEDWPGFEYEFDDSEPDSMLLHASEYGNLDNLLVFIQAYLRKFVPEGMFKLTYAETCEKPRVGQFGGGGLVITADTVRWMNAHTWVDEQLKDLEVEKPRAKKREVKQRTGKGRQHRRAK